MTADFFTERASNDRYPLITHGTFGESLIQNICHVLNKRPPLIGQFGVAAQDDPLDILPMAKLLLKEVDEGDGVLILTDILGRHAGTISH